MSQKVGDSHLSFERLVEYWLNDVDEAATEGIDMHLLGCEACGALLDEVIALGQGVRQAFSGGLVQAFVTADFVSRLQGRGMRVREYSVPRNGSVNCSVAAEDDLLVGRMAAPLAGVNRVDVAVQVSLMDGEIWLYDIPFDAGRGEVLFAPKLAQLRQMPKHDLHVRLLACDEQGAREIGNYTFHHGA